MTSLTMVITACSVLVSDAGVASWESWESTKECKQYEEEFNEEYQESMTPHSCMMRSPIYITQFMEKHPGMMPKKWTCKYQRRTKSI